MIIKSRHYTFGAFFLSIIALLYFWLFSGILLAHFSIISDNHFTKFNGKQFYFCMFFLGGGLMLFLIALNLGIKQISIDTSNKTIQFTSFILRRKTRFDFSYFDGRISTLLTNGYGSNYKTIGFVKDKRVVRYFNTFWVSNYKELNSSLNDIKDLGNLNFGLWKQLKIVFRLPVMI